MRSFAAAVGFLTVIPVPRAVHEDSGALARAVWWFPVVGAIVGFGLAALDSVLSGWFPAPVGAALTVVVWAAMSRGLHLDGLADTADGLLSFRPKEAVLEIMRDPRSGPMAVTAVVSVLALKVAAIYSLDAPGRALFTAAFAGRCAMAGVMGLFPYARPAGVASPFQSGRGGLKVVWCLAALFAVAGATAGFRGLRLALAAALFAWGLSAWINRKLGGYTGDTLGAVCELTETVVLVFACADRI